MYLSMMGWKVANIPLVMGIPAPKEVSAVDRRRIIGLRIDYDQLLLHRQKRQSGLGMAGPTLYTEPAQIFDEIEEARKIYRRGRYATINVTNKPIESSAEEVIELITGRFKDGAHL
jgi:regulator of PEP synthase PpsR (kinase-PPPase family)